MAIGVLTSSSVPPPVAAQSQQLLTVVSANLQQVFSESPHAVAAAAKIQEEFTKRQEEIKKLQQEIVSLRERLGREGVTMGEDERKELQDKLVQKDRKYRWEQQIYDEDLKRRRNEVLNDVQQEIVRAIYSIGQDEKYDLILTDGVVYSDERVNLTDRVIELLKDKAE
jgi:outer membrane protein